MNILLTSQSGQLGGMELRLADESRILNSLGHQTALTVSEFTGALNWLNSLRKEGISAEILDVPPFLEEWKYRHINYLRARFLTSKRFKFYKPDLIHVTYAWTQTGNSRLWLAKHCNIPSIISVHNAFPDWKPSPQRERLIQQAFSGVKGIYGVSDSALERFDNIYGKFYPKDLTHKVIYNFVDTTRFTPSPELRNAIRDKLNIPQNAILIGTVGRLDKQKNPHYILDCFKHIQKLIPDCYLLFIGSGNLEEEIKKRIADEGIKTWVRIIGFRNDIEKYYPAMDLHMLLSLREGFGIATAEAMSCGVPIIGTDVPGTSDILKNSKAGKLVPLDDARAVSQLTVSIVNNQSKRERMGQNARLEVETKFSKIIWQSAIKNFYDDIENKL